MSADQLSSQEKRIRLLKARLESWSGVLKQKKLIIEKHQIEAENAQSHIDAIKQELLLLGCGQLSFIFDERFED